MKLKQFLIALLVTGLTFLSPGFTANAAPRATPTLTAGLVTVTGERLNGASISADLTGWPSVQITYKYQWFANGVKINRATSSTQRRPAEAAARAPMRVIRQQARRRGMDINSPRWQCFVSRVYERTYPF